MQLDGWSEAIKVYDERVTELFGIPTHSASENGITLKVGFSKGNSSFKNSPYFLDPSKHSFSHLTTYKGLFGIINSGVVRLYSLDNSNDPNELFCFKGVSRFQHAIEKLKEHVYTFSFCKTTNILNPLMWIEYGQVALNFEIVNDPLAWDYFRISDMHYGESQLIPKYEKLLDEIHKQYAPWQFEPDLESLLSLLTFHKEEIHISEQESRLMYVPHLLNDRDKAKYDFHVSEIRTGMTKYIEIPLYVGNERETQLYRVKKHEIIRDESIPLIRITSIEFGDNEPRFDQRKLDSIRLDLEHYLIAKFGYQIEVKKELFKTGAKEGS